MKIYEELKARGLIAAHQSVKVCISCSFCVFSDIFLNFLNCYLSEY